MYDKQYTPLPPTRVAPLRVAKPTWFDLPANTRTQLLQQDLPGDTAFNVTAISGTDAGNVDLELTTVNHTKRGRKSETTTYPASGLGGYDQPAKGPTATERVEFAVRNRGGTAHTDAGAGAYRAYLNYDLRPLTVLDKLHLGIPLTEREDDLRKRFNLEMYARMGLLPQTPAFYTPNLEGKTVLSDNTDVNVVDIQNTGSPGVTVFDADVPADRVLYITGVSVNAADYAASDDLRLTFTRGGPDEFYHIECHGAPTAPFELPLHIPALDELSINARAATALSDVTVRIEYAWVNRSIVEKALYDLAGELRSNDALASNRRKAFDILQDYMAAGVPITENLPQILDEAGVSGRLTNFA